MQALQLFCGSTTQGGENCDRFNIKLLEFLTKLNRQSKFSEASKERILRLIDLANKNSNIPFSMFKSVLENKEVRVQISHKNKIVFEKFPIVACDEFEALSEKTQASIWKYMSRLLKICDESPLAANSVSALGEAATSALEGLDIDDLQSKCLTFLKQFRQILEKNGVKEKALLNIVEETIKCLPKIGNVDPKIYSSKVKSAFKDVLYKERE